MCDWPAAVAPPLPEKKLVRSLTLDLVEGSSESFALSLAGDRGERRGRDGWPLASSDARSTCRFGGVDPARHARGFNQLAIPRLEQNNCGTPAKR